MTRSGLPARPKAMILPLWPPEAVVRLSREERALSAIGGVRVADDGTVTGALGLDSHEGFWTPERPFLWRKGRLAWLRAEGYRGGLVVGMAKGRAVGWLEEGSSRWAVEWRPSGADGWETARPRRLLPTPCSSVVLDRAGKVWVSKDKSLIRLDAPERKIDLGEIQAVAVDVVGDVFGNLADGWSPLWAAMIAPDGTSRPLTGKARSSRVNDADANGRAVGHVTYDRPEPNGGLDQPPLPVEWWNGKVRALLALGPSADALAVGEGGDVVGWYEAGGSRRPCRWRGGRCEALPVPLGWGYDAYAVAVNRAGTAAVVTTDGTGTTLCLVPRP